MQHKLPIVLDNTADRSGTETALLKAGALQSAIFNSANFSSIATDAQGVIQIFNVGAERMLGYTAAEVMDRVTPADISDPQELIARAEALSLELETAITPGFDALVFKARRGIEDIYELTYIRKDGSRFPAVVSVTALRDEREIIIGYLLIGTDNTARKQADEKVRSAAQYARSLIEASLDPLVTISSEGKITDVNEGSVQVTGVSREKLIGTDFSDYFTEPERAREGYREAFSKGSVTDYPLTIRHKDASLTEVLYNASVYKDTQGNVLGVFAAARDVTARNQAEAALIKAGALQSAIFNSANFSSIATDAKGVIQIFNVGAERMLGYNAAEVMDKITPADISDPQELIARAEALSHELKSAITPGFDALVFKARRGIEDIYELTYIRKDGSRFPAVVSVTALRDEQNAIIGYLLIGTDNTARKQAEAALLKAGALQSAIFNSANFSSIATDANGVIQIFNVGAERMLGYTAAEVMDKITPADISDPQEVVARAKTLSAELETEITPGFEALVFKASRGIEDIYELTYIRKDGSRFPAVVSVTALRDEQNAIIGYLLIGTDNTARKEIEADQMQLSQRLRDHQFYTRSLFEANIDALMTTDPAGIITDVNKQMEALTGCTRDELIGAPFKNYFTDPEQAEMSIKLVLSEKEVTNYELTVRARDGQETVVSYNATTFYDRDRKLQGVFAAARDVTERKRLDQVLLEKNVELENARAVADKTNLAKSDFLANMSHELRTPLNSVIGFSEVLQNQMFGPINKKQQEYVGNILTSGKHLLSLINDILDLSKVESGKMELELSYFPLQETLEASLIMFREKALKEGISLHLELDQLADINISADQRKFKQILFNLLSNAVKFTPVNGTVAVNATRDGAFIEISVKDTGVGIKDEDIPKLFQTFTQLESVYTKKYEGTGLGLALTRKLVELHGGRIWVKSEVDKGSSFIFNIPIKETAIKVSSASRFDTVINNNSCVLLIEDEPITLTALKYALQNKGYRVLQANGGEEGLEMALRDAPDLIVLDLIMPGMSGFEVANRLQDNKTTEEIPILILTAMDLSSADRAQLAGKVWRIEEKGSLATSEFIQLVETAAARNKAAEAGRPSP